MDSNFRLHMKIYMGGTCINMSIANHFFEPHKKPGSLVLHRHACYELHYFLTNNIICLGEEQVNVKNKATTTYRVYIGGTYNGNK